MNVIFTCGGTGGHINPAIAVAQLVKQRKPAAQILFVGARGGMEEALVPKAGFALNTLRVSHFDRKLTPKGVCHNVAALAHIAGANRKARQIIRQFAPDVIVGTGGYASYPILREGAKMGVSTVVHEANAMPGLTTRMVADTASRILVCFEESKAHYPHPERIEVVGMPVQGEFIYTRREEARKRLGLDSRPLVVSAWGSLGAREMNKKIAEFMALECKAGEPWQHIHATGAYGWRWMPEYVKGLGVDLAGHPSIDMREYIYNMPEVMAAADLIICRAGASTLNEVAASGVPCIVVPSPNVTDNHQEKNAQVLAGRGAAVLLHEDQCDGKILFAQAQALLSDPDRCRRMRKALGEIAVVDSAEKIYETILDLAKTP